MQNYCLVCLRGNSGKGKQLCYSTYFACKNIYKAQYAECFMWFQSLYFIVPYLYLYFLSDKYIFGETIEEFVLHVFVLSEIRESARHLSSV